MDSWVRHVKTPRMRREEEEAMSVLDRSDADKVGMVVVRNLDSDDPEIFFTRVKPKKDGDRADLSLPKGTRDLQDPQTGLWHDPRTLKDRDTTGWKLEPLRVTLAREADEEAGMTLDAIRVADFHDAGMHEFISRKGDHACIQWFGVPLTDEISKHMKPIPDDATETAWVKQSEIDTLAKFGEINPCYAQVAHHVIDGMKRGAFTQFAIPFTQQQLTR